MVTAISRPRSQQPRLPHVLIVADALIIINSRDRLLSLQQLATIAHRSSADISGNKTVRSYSGEQTRPAAWEPHIREPSMR